MKKATRKARDIRCALCRQPWHGLGPCPEPIITKTGIVLELKDNIRDGKMHSEYSAPCGCAFHEEPGLHWHPCPLHGAARDIAVGALEALRFFLGMYPPREQERIERVIVGAMEKAGWSWKGEERKPRQ